MTARAWRAIIAGLITSLSVVSIITGIAYDDFSDGEVDGVTAILVGGGAALLFGFLFGGVAFGAVYDIWRDDDE